jgi:hypothetical protein
VRDHLRRLPLPVKEHDMFGFWFWILTPLVLILVVAFVYDRRHEGVHIKPQEDTHERLPGPGDAFGGL